MFQLLAWGFVADAEVQSRLADLFSQLNLLPAPQRGALADELMGQRVLDEHVGPDYAMRRGRYLNFAEDLVYETPPGLWRPRAG